MSQPSHSHESDTFSADASETAAIALGSNATSFHGGPKQTVREGIAAIASDAVRVIAESPLFLTPCFPAGAGPDFINAAVLVETRLPPQDLLDHLHDIERSFGRVRDKRWEPRSLDLDLLLYGSRIFPSTETIQAWMQLPLEKQKQHAPDGMLVPHPRFHERAFVLGPLITIAPDMVHPILHKTVQELFEALPQAEKAELQAI